jgi:hypothetical protein
MADSPSSEQLFRAFVEAVTTYQQMRGDHQ